jgi:hypothetical protein
MGHFLAQYGNKLGDPDLPVVLDNADTSNMRIYIQNFLAQALIHNQYFWGLLTL